MPFEKESVAVRTSDGRTVELLEPMRYFTSTGAIITVPVGTISDGASTPRTIWPTLPPFGSYWRACVLHDHLYRNTFLPRDYCDQMLNEAMVACGVPDAQRIAIYEGVRMGGWKAFDDDRKALEAKQMT
jgi:hypothetical protein